MSIFSKIKSGLKTIASHVGGAIVGAITGIFTGPAGIISRSSATQGDSSGSLPGEVVFGHAFLTVTGIYSAWGSIYGFYRGLRYGFEHGVMGELHDSVQPTMGEYLDRRARLLDEEADIASRQDPYSFYVHHVQHLPRPTPVDPNTPDMRTRRDSRASFQTEAMLVASRANAQGQTLPPDLVGHIMTHAGSGTMATLGNRRRAATSTQLALMSSIYAERTQTIRGMTAAPAPAPTTTVATIPTVETTRSNNIS